MIILPKGDTVLIIANRQRYEKYMPDLAFVQNCEKIYVPLNTPDAEILNAAYDAEVILADAIADVSPMLIQNMPNLKLIHSEGVAYNRIGLASACERGIYVCNNKGANAGAVAEQTILLMLALLRDFSNGREAELAGDQIGMKERKMVEGIRELSECKVGLIGFGDIAKAVARRLQVFGCELYYYNRTRQTPETEADYGITYLDLKELSSTCDILSVHVAITPQTTGMINEAFLKRMKKDAFLINTARGEAVDNEALARALTEGWIAGAGLDTIAPEPTPKEHPLIDLPQSVRSRIEYSPHLGGITTGTFKRCHKRLWANVQAVSEGRRPENIVNNI